MGIVYACTIPVGAYSYIDFQNFNGSSTEKTAARGFSAPISASPTDAPAPSPQQLTRQPAAAMGDEEGEAPEPGYTGERNERKERHGTGTAVFVNGDKFEGGYANGRRHGQGKYTFKSGAVYEGAYHNNAKHGTGKMSYVDKSCYDGDWKMDRRHGMGSYTYTNGDVYAGAWCNGVKHGKGCYFFMVRLLSNRSQNLHTATVGAESSARPWPRSRRPRRCCARVTAVRAPAACQLLGIWF